MQVLLFYGYLFIALVALNIYIFLAINRFRPINIGAFVVLPKVLRDYLGLLIIPTLITVIPYAINVRNSNGAEYSLAWSLYTGSAWYQFLTLVVLFPCIVASYFLISRGDQFEKIKAVEEEKERRQTDPSYLNALEAAARFNAYLKLPDEIRELIVLKYADYRMVMKVDERIHEALVMREAQCVNHLMELVPAHGLLTKGETQLYDFFEPTLKRASEDDTAHPYFLSVYSLGEFKQYLYEVGVRHSLPDNIRTQHHQIIANSGHGKTQCIQSMIVDDWNSDSSIVVIDSQGDLINNILAHAPLERVVLIDPETCPPALNIFANKARGEMELATAIELFEYIFSALDAKLTGKQSLVYRYLSRLLMEIPGATIETMRDLLQPNSTEKYQEIINGLGGNAKAFFDEYQRERNNQYNETRQEVLRRLLMVLESETFSRMLATPNMAIDMASLLDSGKIILISTSKRLLKDGSSLFGRIFVAMIMQAVMTRKQGQRKRTYLYIDEFADYAEESRVLLDLFEQSRKYELGMVICHQYLGQLPLKLAKSVSANTAIKFAGGVSAEDARALASQMHTSAEDILRQPALSFQAWFKGIGTIKWTVQPGRMEALPKHSERTLDEFRRHMRDVYGPVRVTPPPPTSDDEQPDQGDKW